MLRSNSPILKENGKNTLATSKWNKYLEYVHMRSEMNSYRFEISNRRQNKFSSHEISFRLHFKTTRYFDGHFTSDSVYMIFYHPKWNSFVKMTDMKSIPGMNFKRTCALNAISNESALIHFVSGKFCLHENLMPVWIFISVKMTDMKSTSFWVSFRLNSCEHK